MNFPIFKSENLRNWIVVAPDGVRFLMQAHFLRYDCDRINLYVWTQNPGDRCVQDEVVASFVAGWSAYLEKLPEGQ